MTRFILLLTAFAVTVAVAVAPETVILKRYIGGTKCQTFNKITDRWDGTTCFKKIGGGYRILGQVDKCEEGANYTTRDFGYTDSNCTGNATRTSTGRLNTFGVGLNTCGPIAGNIFSTTRSYRYCCGPVSDCGDDGSTGGAMPVRTSAALLLTTAAVVVVSLL